MKKSFRRAALLTLVAALLFSCAPRAAAAAREQEGEPLTVRVGVYESNGFIALNDNNEMTGYGADFMGRLAKYANVKYEYVRLTWSECLAGLLSGKIDIVTDARRTAEREKLYDFSVQNIGQIQAAIFVPKTKEDIYFNDYEAMDGLRVGFEEDSLNMPLYRQYAAKHGFQARAVSYPSTSDLRAALKRGEIDAFGGDTHVYTDDLKVVSIYSTDPNYIMAKKDSKIMKRLNLAIEEMFSRAPEKIAEQYDYLANRQLYGDMLLTRKEAAYIKEHPALRVAVFANRKPLSWYDEKTKSFNGVAIKMMSRLSEITGLRFEYVPAAGGASPRETMLEHRDIDLAIPAVGIEHYDDPIRVTDPLYALTAAMVVTDGSRGVDDKGFTASVSKTNYGIRHVMPSYFKGIRFKLYNTAEECIGALKSGEVDAYAATMYELEYWLKSPRNEGLRVSYTASCPLEHRIAMRQDAPDELYGILNNAIALIPQAEADRVVRDYGSFSQYDDTLSDRLYENRYPLTGIGLFFAFVLAGWLWYSALQKRTIAQIELKSEEARRAAEEAKRANAAKSDFLSRMSHDMRTPMNAILGLAELTKDMEMSAGARDAIDKISGTGQFLLGLINDTLDMSKIEAGKLILNVRAADSRKVLEETLTLLRAYAREKNVSIAVSKKNIEHGFVKIDKLRVQQILMNIMSNAVKFSPDGGRVELDIERCEQNGRTVCDKFVVTDHGVGMSAEFLPKLFKPFEQERGRLTADSGGSGVGMAIAKRLIDLMNGRIEVESAVGVGTKVTVWLPFESCDAAAAQEAAEQARRDIPAGTRVLLCEDNKMNMIVAKGFLQKMKCVVDCAADGKEGLEKFRSSAPGDYAAVLMDIRMPVMDGIEATKAIRALKRSDAKTIPVIALTANAFDEDREKCLAAGMNAHVAKPIYFESLLQTLSSLLPPAENSGETKRQA
ncbi:MAG: transporter substrate-binding domain-containing protein [bacterium]|nr:transporter substrate-binding domain-containing protein [bacterium]